MFCWCYTVNEGFLLPALVSARQLRTCLGDVDDDILIVCIGEESETTRLAASAARTYGVELILAPAAMLRGLPMYGARLFLTELIDRPYEYITYVDADTQFVGDVRAFAAAIPKPGSILVGPDIMSIAIDHPSKSFDILRDYFQTIGLSKAQQLTYFNAGIMKFRSSDWDAIARESLDVMGREEAKTFRYPDQDALNIVLGGHQTLVSFKWNYPAFFLGRGLDDIVAPSLIHFMSRPRPWDGPFPPWGRSAHAPYRAFLAAHPELKHLFKPARNGQLARYMLQQIYKAWSEQWGTALFRERIRASEAKAFV